LLLLLRRRGRRPRLLLYLLWLAGPLQNVHLRLRQLLLLLLLLLLFVLLDGPHHRCRVRPQAVGAHSQRLVLLLLLMLRRGRRQQLRASAAERAACHAAVCTGGAPLTRVRAARIAGMPIGSRRPLLLLLLLLLLMMVVVGVRRRRRRHLLLLVELLRLRLHRRRRRGRRLGGGAVPLLLLLPAVRVVVRRMVSCIMNPFKCGSRSVGASAMGAPCLVRGPGATASSPARGRARRPLSRLVGRRLAPVRRRRGQRLVVRRRSRGRRRRRRLLVVVLRGRRRRRRRHSLLRARRRRRVRSQAQAAAQREAPRGGGGERVARVPLVLKVHDSPGFTMCCAVSQAPDLSRRQRGSAVAREKKPRTIPSGTPCAASW
jgi:hypothetical protein